MDILDIGLFVIILYVWYKIVMWFIHKNSVKYDYDGYRIHIIENREEMDDFPNDSASFVLHGDILYLLIRVNSDKLVHHITSNYSHEKITTEFLTEIYNDHTKHIATSIELL